MGVLDMRSIIPSIRLNQIGMDSTIKIKTDYLDLAYFQQAFIHKSISSSKNNERLEFLGDAVLEIVISEHLFNNFPLLDEGRLTLMRASLVNTQMLSKIFMQFDCKDLLKTSKGTNNLDETHKFSIYAGTLEACIGAIFLEMGLKESKRFILEIFNDHLLALDENAELKDAKSRLQEYLQANNLPLPIYNVESNHAGNNFLCSVDYKGEVFSASATIKKEAEQKTAALILSNLNQV